MKTFFHLVAFLKRPKTIVTLVLTAIALVFPLFTANNYIISVVANCFIYAAFGVAWNMISGYGGQTSWCHSAFVAIGGYTSIIMYNFFGISPFLSMPIGMLISFVVASGIGYIAFRYRGPFFAITTIAFAEIIRILLLHFEKVTNGSRGISVRYKSASFFNLMFKNDVPFYYILLAALVIMLFITYKFEKSKTGYFLKAVNGDEDAAISVGVRTDKVKHRTFQLSAVLTSVLGSLFAFYMTFIEPNSICSLDMSVKIGSVVIVGGISTIFGPVVGAFTIIPLTELANIILGSSGGSQLLYGLALILVVILQPKGILYFFDKSSRKGSILNRIGKKDEGSNNNTGMIK